MAASIIHRISGVALSTVGLAVLTWWLWAIARGGDSYSNFVKAAWNPVGIVILVGLSWAFFQHLFTGIRHLVTDTGANFELDSNKRSAILTFVGSVLLTVLVWLYIFGVRA